MFKEGPGVSLELVLPIFAPPSKHGNSGGELMVRKAGFFGFQLVLCFKKRVKKRRYTGLENTAMRVKQKNMVCFNPDFRLQPDGQVLKTRVTTPRANVG